MANRGLCSKCAAVCNDNLTSLEFSIRIGHDKCTRTHLKSCDGANQPQEQYSKLLYSVVRHNNIKYPASFVKMLVKAGGDVNYVDDVYSMYPVLHRAIISANPKAAAALVKLGADLTKTNGLGETPLQLAARLREKRFPVDVICKILIKYGADLTERDQRGNTPLLNAVEAANMPAIKTLIQAGADVNVKNNGGHGVLAIEVLNRFQNKHERLELLINAGADIKAERTSVPYYVAWDGFDKSLDLLIKAGADIKKNSFECLDAACFKCRDKCLDLLLDAGADVNQVSRYGRTALFASMHSNVYCISRLLQAGVPVNLYDYLYMNALQSFVKRHGSNKAELGLLLYAAGEKLDVPENLRLRRQERRLKPIDIKVPDYLQEVESAETEQRLDQICRKVIRRHFIQLDQRKNLFQQIRKLPLPTCIVSYLLYGCSV